MLKLETFLKYPTIHKTGKINLLLKRTLLVEILNVYWGKHVINICICNMKLSTGGGPEQEAFAKKAIKLLEFLAHDNVKFEM